MLAKCKCFITLLHPAKHQSRATPTLHSLMMRVWLIRHLPLLSPTLQRNTVALSHRLPTVPLLRRCRVPIGLLSGIGTAHINVFRLLNLAIVLLSIPVSARTPLTASTTATADADHPEEAARHAKGYSEPCRDQHRRSERGFDAVGFECAIEGAHDDTPHCGRDGRCCDDEERADAADDGGETAAHARAEGDDAEKELGNGGGEGNDIQDEDNLGDGVIGLERLGDFAGERVLERRVVEAPECHRVEPVGSGGLGAGRLVGRAGGAVVPESDGVVIC